MMPDQGDVDLGWFLVFEKVIGLEDLCCVFEIIIGIEMRLIMFLHASTCLLLV